MCNMPHLSLILYNILGGAGGGAEFAFTVKT